MIDRSHAHVPRPTLALALYDVRTYVHIHVTDPATSPPAPYQACRSLGYANVVNCKCWNAVPSPWEIMEISKG